MLIFRLPFQNQFLTITNNNSKVAYSLHPFISEKTISFPGEIVEIKKEEIEGIIFSLPHSTIISPNENQEEYCQKIEKAIAITQKEDLQKLVIARKKIIKYASINMAKSFLNLCEKFPNAFVYAFSDENISWMGAFSETLGVYNKNTETFQTMSLAGTLPLEEDWTKKEIEEQKPVTEYIYSLLKKFSSEIKTSKTYNHLSGNIKHLRTDFSTKIEEKHLENLLQQLHPTPAVCGIPKEFCQEKIQELENFDREHYAGYTRVETEEKIYAFVNLRCGKFYKNHAEIFVGGGITKDSNPEKEWRETELKSQAIINNLEIKKLT